MIIYNVTIKVEKRIAEDWLLWLKEEHIPEVMKSNCFTHYKIVRLLEIDESEGPTYAVQYFAASKADYNRYIELYATALRDENTKQWGNAFIAFRTVMQIVQ